MVPAQCRIWTRLYLSKPRPYQLLRLHTVSRTWRCWVTGGTVAWGGRRRPRIHTAAHSPLISASLAAAAAAAAAALPAPSMQCLGEHRLRTGPACTHTGERAGQCTQPRCPQRAPPACTPGSLQAGQQRHVKTSKIAPQLRRAEGGGHLPCAVRTLTHVAHTHVHSSQPLIELHRQTHCTQHWRLCAQSGQTGFT
jgi:hypothetical protein